MSAERVSYVLNLLDWVSANQAATAATPQGERVLLALDGFIHAPISAAITLGLWLLFVVFFVMIVAWSWHVIAPARWRWLPPEDVQKLEDIIFGGVVMRAIKAQLKKLAQD